MLCTTMTEAVWGREGQRLDQQKDKRQYIKIEIETSKQAWITTLTLA